MNLINDFDKIFLCETWLKEYDKLNIDGFENTTSFCRSKNIGIRNEGEIAVFGKSNIADGIIVEKIINDGIVLIKLDKLFLIL